MITVEENMMIAAGFVVMALILAQATGVRIAGALVHIPAHRHVQQAA